MSLHSFRLALLAAVSIAAASPHAAAATSFGTFAYSPSGVQELILNGGATTVAATDVGWYNQFGHHIANYPNYFAGCDNCGTSLEWRYRDFFVFDLSKVVGPITSAQLSLGQPDTIFGPGYKGPAGGIIYRNFDVSTPLADLTAGYVSGAVSIYDDLGTGDVYASTLILPSSVGHQVDITLNAAGLAALNGAVANGGAFAIGGDVVYGGVPEPSTWAMMLLGFGALAFASRGASRRHQTAEMA